MESFVIRLIVNKNVWPEVRLEDFYQFKSQGSYHIVCENNVRGVSGHERWGVHLYSAIGINKWMKYDPLIVYDHELAFENDSVLHSDLRERPQLLIENNEITHM